MAINVFRILLSPIRYSTGRDIIQILFRVLLFAHIIHLYNRYEQFIKPLSKLEGNWKYWYLIAHFTWGMFDSNGTLLLLWIALRKSKAWPLKIIIILQIFCFPVIFLHVCTRFTESGIWNSYWNIGHFIIKIISILLRLYALYIVVIVYRQLNYDGLQELCEKYDVPISNIYTTKANSEIVPQNFFELDGNDTGVSLHDFQKYVIKPWETVIDRKVLLGEGQFGRVFEGRCGKIKIAAKVTKCEEAMSFSSVLHEIKVLILAKEHKHIIKFHGVTSSTSSKDNIVILLEYCSNGSLDTFLANNKSTFGHFEINSEDLFAPNLAMSYVNMEMHRTFTTLDLLRISTEVVLGMEHLLSNKIIHGDLAARNVLLTKDLRAKLTDFGMARRLYNYKMYCQEKETKALLPWRWMSPEALIDLRFSEKSDVWSYGVLLWEIFSLGDFPYRERNWSSSTLNQLCSGSLKLKKPPYASKILYDLMLESWIIDSKRRPSFSQIIDRLNTSKTTVLQT